MSGASSLENAAADPLESFDVIYNTGQDYPQGATARARLEAFFERGGGYIATSQSITNFSFLHKAHPALVKGNLTQGSDSAGGGIARWDNVGASGPLTGGFTGTDNLYLPSNITWFSSLPTGATVDGRYLAMSARCSWPASGATATKRRRVRRSSSTGRPRWEVGTWPWRRTRSREGMPSASGR